MTIVFSSYFYLLPISSFSLKSKPVSKNAIICVECMCRNGVGGIWCVSLIEAWINSVGWGWSHNLVWSESLNLLLWLAYNCCKDISNLRVPAFLNMNMPGPNMNFKIKPLFACTQKPFSGLKLILCCRNNIDSCANIKVQLWFGWSSSAAAPLLVHPWFEQWEQGWALSPSMLDTWLQHLPASAVAMESHRKKFTEDL